MCRHEWEIVRLSPQSVGARLADGTVVDLQAAHVAQRGHTSPHLRDAISFRLSAAYGADLVRDLLRSRKASS